MGCGAPIKSGFFCPKCEKRAEDSIGSDKPAGSRFTGRAAAQKKKALLVEDITRLVKRLLVLAVVVGAAWFGWAQFGDRIMATVRGAQELDDQERYDPTRDVQVVEGEDGQPASGQKRKTFGTETVPVEGTQ
jgi:hypothetical protein